VRACVFVGWIRVSAFSRGRFRRGWAELRGRPQPEPRALGPRSPLGPRALARRRRRRAQVSRSLAACEGALLVVDASQGVEAQTLANVWMAIENDLEIIPVLNKIDLPGAGARACVCARARTR
jgi:hypothetical protein